MESVTHRKPQPGWTGTCVLRIVLATPRTVLSVDPIGRCSAVAASRSEFVSSWRSTLRNLPFVSMTRIDIETNGAMLVQRQTPRAFQRFDIDAKVQKTASAANRSSTKRPASDPRSPHRSSRDVVQSARSLPTQLPSCVKAAAGSGVLDQARPALQTGLKLSVLRIDTGRSRGSCGRPFRVAEERSKVPTKRN